jgi:hypothetical protein
MKSGRSVGQAMMKGKDVTENFPPPASGRNSIEDRGART